MNERSFIVNTAHRQFFEHIAEGRLPLLVPLRESRHLATLLSRFRIRHRFHNMLRHDRYGRRWRDQVFKRRRGRLPDELPDCDDRAHNAHRINRSFHHAPAFLLRADQQAIGRFSFVLHNSKTPRSSRFVYGLLIVHDWF